MNFILEERENILANNNTAQDYFISHLENGDSSSTELVIHESLHGNLDFSVLSQKGYKNVKTIEFKGKGEILGVSNLPQGLEKFVISHQLLIELDNLPKSLIHLDCQQNSIRELNVSALNKLRVLQLSENRVEALENLPDSLEELYCDNNRIRVLNLRDLLQLRVLHLSGNRAVIVENLPPSIVDFQSENNPYLEIQYANLHSTGEADDEAKGDEDEDKINYLDSLSDYFKLKQKYEETLYKNKKKAYENAPTKSMGKKRAARVVPQCIQCKQPGGTLFSKKDRTLYAVCGNKSSPCALNIELYNGSYHWLDKWLVIFGEEELVNTKKNIICKKLDSIFHYENETIALKKFKENMEEFTLMNDETNETYVKNDQLYKDDVREELRKRKTQQMYDLMGSIKELITQYKQDGNTQLLRAAVELQVNELNPEIQNLRMLRYEIMEMHLKTGRKSGGEDAEESVQFHEANLFQRYASLPKMFITMEPPRVVKYKTV